MNAVRIISIVFGSLLMGALLGLIPFFYGRKKGYDTMGLICMVLCMIGSFIAGLFLSVPICLVSVIVIAVKKKPDGDANSYYNPHNDSYMNQNPNQYMNQNPNQYTNPNPNQYTNQYTDPNQNTNQYYSYGQQAWGAENGQQNSNADVQNLYCPACGKQLKPGTAYCTNCGRKM